MELKDLVQKAYDWQKSDRENRAAIFLAIDQGNGDEAVTISGKGSDLVAMLVMMINKYPEFANLLKEAVTVSNNNIVKDYFKNKANMN